MRNVSKMRTVTVDLPDELVVTALKLSGENITAAIEEGLKLLVTRIAYSKLSRLRGKVKCHIPARD